MSNNLGRIMQEKGITRYRLSKLSGVAQSTIADWENERSNPSADKLAKVANVLGVSVEQLLGGEDGQNKTPVVRYNERDVKVLEAFKKLPSELRDATYQYILSLVKAQIDEDNQ